MKIPKLSIKEFTFERRRKAAFTLLEVLVTVFIVAVVSSLLITGFRFYRERAEGVRCANNMRSLQAALAAAVVDQGHWPQEPAGLQLVESPDQLEDWWIEHMAQYGVTEKNWQCPTIMRKITAKSKNGRPRTHYSPTSFDANPSTPYKWSTQPWLIEIGNMHGDGPLVCFPDGSVRSMNEVLGQ